MLGLDGDGAAEQETRLRRLDHAQVVVAVARGDGLETAGMQRADRGQLRLIAAHAVAGDGAVVSDFQRVAEDGRPAELLHDGLGELLERVADDDHLGLRAQVVQELLGAGKR